MKSSLLILLIGLTITLTNNPPPTKTTTTPPNWPATFEHRPLTRQPLSPTEQAFAKSFPGHIATFTSPGDRQIILRQVTRATRKLHNSATCLNAAGFALSPRKSTNTWAYYTAKKDGQNFTVREQIISQTTNKTHTEASPWFWHALFNPNSGPWLAITVIEPTNLSTGSAPRFH